MRYECILIDIIAQRLTTMNPPKRTDEHRSDTIAVRKVITSISPDWVIRELSERDYGIDMMVEIFDGDYSTGKVVFFQVKGTSKKIITDKSTLSFQLKKRTLLYAERFAEPFLLLYTSTDEKEPVFFLWLQKYITHRLDNDHPHWRSEDTETIVIYIPKSNVFDYQSNKIGLITSYNIYIREALEFVRELSGFTLKLDALSEAPKNHEHLDELTKKCEEHVKKISKLSTLRKYSQINIDYKDGMDTFSSWRHDPENFEHFQPGVDKLVTDFHLLGDEIINCEDLEEFAEEMLGEMPY